MQVRFWAELVSISVHRVGSELVAEWGRNLDHMETNSITSHANISVAKIAAKYNVFACNCGCALAPPPYNC